MTDIPLRQYRARAWGKWLGPWRDERRHAEDDAVETGNAHRTMHENGESGPYLGINCKIVKRIKPSA
jgi:hypothetical protein